MGAKRKEMKIKKLESDEVRKLFDELMLKYLQGEAFKSDAGRDIHTNIEMVKAWLLVDKIETIKSALCGIEETLDTRLKGIEDMIQAVAQEISDK